MAVTPEEACRILGVEAGAAPERIQEAYRKAALKTHPDRAKGYGLHDRKEWLRVRDAYECLRAAGFKAPLPEPEAPRRPAEPKGYKAPEWLERRWAEQGGDRLGEHFRLDDHESRALVRTIGWLVFIVAGVYLAFHYRHELKPKRELAPKPGFSIRW